MTPYPAAIGLAVASFFIILLVLPPLGWHIKARNIGASSVIIWCIILNLTIFINAIIWPDDDFASHYNGSGLCDVEVKLQIASQVALPASFACILRSLATVMDTDNLTITKLNKNRNLAIDLLWCVGFPLLQMLSHYIVQPTRYALLGVSGCQITVSNNWVMVLLCLTPPLIWTAICAFYAVLVIYRLYRYRRSFKLILQHNGTNKSRFLRLLIICMLWVFASVPVACYIFSITFQEPRVPFSWSDVHDPQDWNVIIMVPSNGLALRDRYVWLGTGLLMFLFFGIGKDALRMYKDILKLGGCLSRVKQGRAEYNATDASGSRAQMGKRSTTSTESTFGSSIDLEAMHHPAERL